MTEWQCLPGPGVLCVYVCVCCVCFVCVYVCCVLCVCVFGGGGVGVLACVHGMQIAYCWYLTAGL